MEVRLATTLVPLNVCFTKDKWEVGGHWAFLVPSHTAVLKSDHLEHPGNCSVEWQKDLQGWRKKVWQVHGAWKWIGGEKKAVPQSGGNPFCGQTKGREKGVEGSIGFVQEENLSRPQTGEWEVLSVSDIFANSIWSSNSEVLEMCNFLHSGTVAHTPGEREGGPRGHSVV